MRKQRDMAKVKDQNRTPEKELRDEEIANLSNAELKTVVVRMLKKLTGYCNSIKKDPGRNEGYIK